MSARFDGNSANYLGITASLPNLTSFTMMQWARIVTDRNTWSCFFSASDGSNYLSLTADASGTNIRFDTNAGTPDMAFDLTVGTDYLLAVTGAAGTLNFYGMTAATAFGAAPALTAGGTTGSYSVTSPTSMRLGNSVPFGDPLNGRIGVVHLYEAVLTEAEIIRQSRHIRPFRRTNLYGWWPLLNITSSGVRDYSAHGHGWTVNGTLTSEAHPPVRWGAPGRIVGPVVAGGGGGAIISPYYYMRRRRWMEAA